MKKAILVIILFFSLQKLFPQELSMELSISWEMEKDYFSENNDSILTAFLNITYTNNSNTAYYTRKVFNYYGFPYIYHNCYNVYLWGERERVEFLKTPDLDKLPTDSLIAQIQFYGTGSYWEILDTQMYIERLTSVEYEDLNWNCSFSTSYNYIFENENIESYIDYPGSNIPNISKGSESEVTLEDNIRTNYAESFIFLHPRSSYTEKLNLIVFQKIGGFYRFIITPYDIRNIYISDEILIKKEIALPEKIGIYNLYKQEIKSNEVEVTFE